MKKAITINEIAKALDLSRNTVSKALNGQYVPNKTRTLVLKKAQELGYKSLDSITISKDYRILLLSGKPFHNISYFYPLTGAIESYCFENNYEFFQFTCGKENLAFKKIVDNIRKSRIDGIVAIECFETTLVDNLLSLDIPICFIDFPMRTFKTKNGYDVIDTSNQTSVQNFLTDLIVNKGFSRFSFVGDYTHCSSFYKRYQGMISALDDFNLPHSSDEDILENDKFEYGDPSAIKNKIKEFKKLPNCFVCCNDFVARNTVIALKELGYHVPTDTTVIGYDGVKEAFEQSPTITTFRVDTTFLGQEAIRILLSRIENKGIPNRTIIVDSTLTIGESTKK